MKDIVQNYLQTMYKNMYETQMEYMRHTCCVKTWVPLLKYFTVYMQISPNLKKKKIQSTSGSKHCG